MGGRLCFGGVLYFEMCIDLSCCVCKLQIELKKYIYGQGLNLISSSIPRSNLAKL